MPATQIQFAASGSLGERLADRAHEWGLSTGQTAKALTVLAEHGLDPADFDEVSRLAVGMGGSAASIDRSFVSAVEFLSWRRQEQPTS